MQIDHLSASRINMYLRCQRQYYYRYVQGKVEKPSGAMMLGSSFHRAMEDNYRQKIQSRQDKPLDDVLDFFSTEFDSRAPETDFQGQRRGKVKDSGVSLTRTYHTDVARVTQPTDCERQFVLEFKNRSWQFTGFIDLIDDKRMVRETKTTAKTPKEPRPEHLLQTTAYAVGYRAAQNGKERGTRIEYAVRKKEPVVVSFDVEIGDPEVLYFLSMMDNVAEGIDKEVWIPNRNSNLCSRKYCGFWAMCEASCGGRIRD